MTESLATRYTVGGHEGPVNESALKRQVEALTAQLQEAKEALKLQQQETESQQWLDKCLGRFDEVMRTHFDRGLRDYMEAILLEISKMIPLVQAALYVPDEQENNETPTIKLAAGYACNIDRLEKKCYMLGEGMIGQVAKSRKPYVLENLGKHAPIMQGSSLVQLIPQSLAVYPITYNEDLKGILELCCIQPPQARQLELLERLCRNLGASLESQLNQQKMKRLYRQSQEAYQQLAAQEEEMRQNLEELQATQEEMRRIEVEMKRQGESLNRTMQNVPGIVYSFQLEIAEQRQGFLYMSKQVEHILGFTAKTVLEDYGKNQTVQIHPDDVADHDRKMLESLRQQTKFVWEGRMQHRDGHWVYLRAESTPYGDESDANRMIWDGILLDIRDQKRYEQEMTSKTEELAASEEELKQKLEVLMATQEEMNRMQKDLETGHRQQARLVESIHGIVFTLREQGGELQTVALSKRQLWIKLGLRQEELYNPTAGTFALELHPAEIENIRAQLQDSKGKSEAVDFNLRLKNSEGKWISFKARCLPYQEEGIWHWDGVYGW